MCMCSYITKNIVCIADFIKKNRWKRIFNERKLGFHYFDIAQQFVVLSKEDRNAL